MFKNTGIHPRTEDLQHRRFGRLVVSRFHGYRAGGKQNYAYWWCDCDCGAEKAIQARFLKNGLTVSCGCFQRERASENNRKPPGEAGFNRLFRSYAGGAKHRGIRFELTTEDAMRLFSGNCHYCGCEPIQESRSCSGGPRTTTDYSVFLHNGIDRVSNNDGYTRTNCVSCCKVCNQAKHTMSKCEFLLWVARIAAHQGIGG